MHSNKSNNKKKKFNNINDNNSRGIFLQNLQWKMLYVSTEVLFSIALSLF